MFSEGCKSSVTTNGNVGPPCVTGLFVQSFVTDSEGEAPTSDRISNSSLIKKCNISCYR